METDEADAFASARTSPRPAEEAFLRQLRERRDELSRLLASVSDHWGFEDPVYRFYHQSWKVFSLQARTEAIVRVLASLAPDRPMNPWFATIVAEGTGRVFKDADNKAWLPATRPIVEAFFHARYFLEMAVRYSTVESPPMPLPSGYAALLYLYGLR